MKKFRRLMFLIVLPVMLLTACVSGGQTNNQYDDVENLPPAGFADYADNVKVGAIRWDAWTGELSFHGETMDVSLSPEEFHYRLPWSGSILDEPEPTKIIREDARDNPYFAYSSQFPKNNPLTPLATKSVTTAGNTQEIIDKEIRFAKASGLDYWAILWYDVGDDSVLTLQRDLYLASMQRHGMEWCHILGGGFAVAASGGGAETDAMFNTLLDQLEMDNYTVTLDGRPVVYVFEPEPWMTNGFDRFLTRAAARGLDPYIVGMVFDTTTATIENRLNSIYAEAVSSYCTGGSNGITFERNTRNERFKWDSFKETDFDVIPSITTGWDKRPRHIYANPWEYPHAASFATQWMEQGTPEEIADHMGDGMDFVEFNGSDYSFRSVIVYAWNENDEGGWINPTLFEMRDSGRPLRLDAIRDELITRRVTYEDIASNEYKSAIEALSASYTFAGVYGDKFYPNREVSSAEFISWLVRTMGLYYDQAGQGAEFYDYDVSVARGLGLLEGMDDSAIALNIKVDETQAELMMARALYALNMADGLQQAQSFVSGVTENKPFTRAGVAAMLLEVLEKEYPYLWKQ